MTGSFGDIISLDQIERRVLDTLSTPPLGSSYPLIVYYLAEVERQRGLRPQSIPVPPGPDSYRGGLDFNTVMDEWCPMLTVHAEPSGSVERNDDDGYGGSVQFEIAATVTGEDEDAARLLAGRYGAAVMSCVAQNSGLGTRVDPETGDKVPFATQTSMTAMPRTEFVSETVRRLVRSVVTFQAWIDSVVVQAGPVEFGPSPYLIPGVPARFSNVDIDLRSETALGTAGPASGARVVSSSGHVVIGE